ncbi:MAG: hypothetical protein ACTHMR_10030, partial [Thermomicrobiales bacterium]
MPVPACQAPDRDNFVVGPLSEWVAASLPEWSVAARHASTMLAPLAAAGLKTGGALLVRPDGIIAWCEASRQDNADLTLPCMMG